ncbi:MAG: SURF1 family protein [Burkholderiales bacterium]
MTIRFGAWHFDPTRWPTIIAIIFVAITLALGQWQTRRAEQKQSIQDRVDALATAPVLILPAKLVAADEFAQRIIEARGEFLEDKTIFIDNRVYKKRAGYHVITPLRLEGGNVLVAINRGWTPANPRREILPSIAASPGRQVIRGIAGKPLYGVYELSHDNTPGPVKQNVSLDRLRAEWGMPLQPIVLFQTNVSGDGLVRDWPRPDAGADTHRAYSLQWYAMAVMGVLLWVSLNLRKTHDAK